MRACLTCIYLQNSLEEEVESGAPPPPAHRQGRTKAGGLQQVPGGVIGSSGSRLYIPAPPTLAGYGSSVECHFTSSPPGVLGSGYRTPLSTTR